MTPIYITCFNSPDLCRSLLGQLSLWGHLQRHPAIISDQSDERYSKEYAALAMEYRCQHVKHKNEGASGAKRNVLKHAEQNRHAFVHQVSEDFIIDENFYHGVARGVGTFLEDSEAILSKFPDLDFVRWNIITSFNGDMSYMWRDNRWFGALQLRAIRESQLLFAVGAVQYSNWPATWRVEGVKKIWDAADKWKPSTEKDAEIAKGSGGEWTASNCGVGKGAVLIANPMRHPERIKHIESKP